MRRLALVLACCCPPLLAADLTFTGYARSLDGGELLYVETHAVADAGTPRERRVVSYLCGDGELTFARKTIDYAANRLAPAFVLDDARGGVIEGLERKDGLAIVFARGRAAGAEHREKALPATAALVADAGFDELVRARWDTLARGDDVVVPFLVPSRLETLKFRIRRTGAVAIDGAAATVFRLSLAGPLGWFVPDIDVTYRDADRRLLRYRGTTNIRDATGEMIAAQIDFPDAARSDAPVDLEALRARPLVTRCR